MNTLLTIVAYHFVRELRTSSFPRIKGLELEHFIGQLEYIKRHYTPITMAECCAALYDGQPLPPRPILLTFDDGYKDHLVASELLVSYGMSGAIFPIGRAVSEQIVSPMNKIHFTLASADENDVLERLKSMVDSLSIKGQLRPFHYYWQNVRPRTRFDQRSTATLKCLLQHGLPSPYREQCLDELFAHFVTSDERGFSEELYLSRGELRSIADSGLHIGSHSWSHHALGQFAPEKQHELLSRSLQFLAELGVPTDSWTLCYPYGSYDQSTVEIARALGCVVGLTTEVGLAEIPNGSPLTLPRLDTNDLPMQSHAPAADWTQLLAPQGGMSVPGAATSLGK